MADGKVTLDTSLDNKGLIKGIQNIKGMFGGLNGVVRKLGATIAAVFGARQIISFMADSSKAAMSLSDALTGLRSILEGQGRSFSKAQSFIEEYTSDGLIPATNAITAYKNLASRGYDDSQIQQVLLALKDASAYGRQASYTMGEAVQSATEGLKNENSILVDNAGVTKNVAKMWEEYAASIGTTANNLTQQQKIQAEVTGILEETKFQTGDAATVAGTLSGQLQQLSFNFNNLKVAVGNALNPIVQSFLPIINTAISTLVRFANAVAAVIGLILGKASVSAGNLAESNDAVASSASAGAAAEKDLADATTAAGKAAKKSLAGFDELNRLQGDAGGGASSGAVGGGAGGGGISVEADVAVEDTVSPKFQAIADKIQSLLTPLREIDFGPAIDAFGRLGEAAGRLGGEIAEGLEWAWHNVLVPLASWTIEESGPETVGLLAAGLDLLSAVLGTVNDGIQTLWKYLSPVFSYIRDIAVEVIGDLRKLFEDLAAVFVEKSETVSDTFENLGEIFTVVWENILRPIMDNVLSIFRFVFDNVSQIIVSTVDNAIDVFHGVTEFIAGVFSGDWDRAWAGVTEIFDGVVTWLTELADTLLGNFGLTFEDLASIVSEAWGAVVDTVVSIWDGVTGAITDAINGLISMINGMISGIVDGVNAVIGTLNNFSFSIPSWVPEYGGNRIGFDIGYVNTPQIPYLAKGAVLPANKPFLAMVGDQKHGTNVEAPLSTIQEAVAVVMEDVLQGQMAGFEAVVEVLREILEAIYGIEIGDEVIAKAARRYQQKLALAKGR